MFFITLSLFFVYAVFEAKSAPVDLTDRYLEAVRFLYGSDLVHINERIPEDQLEVCSLKS
jgi:hypothetical protein